ncbi:hypothetical protein PHLGIDRAFT_11474 [Phlebiopsis gigantea 11061_1 CR5-6]|uniref:Uncharacterized protein n=1 Tax=Phlebiopsis gigantea (strain 11061_1 CR5-6) TaxID=745531 RepID=A0A0C3SE65_PHLG1|nr:hypothetical protein PHLGIDRAFT_11474 [Phlebiopsis gigantea 11061_1 CR5-6]
MAPNKLVKPTRPAPRRAHTNPTTHTTGSDGALPHSFQQASAFNHSNPEVRLSPRDTPTSSAARPSIHTYSATHIQRPSTPQQVEIQTVEGGWQIVKVLRVQCSSSRTSQKHAATASSSSLTISSTLPGKNANDVQHPSFVKIDGLAMGPYDTPGHVSQAEAMFNTSKRGWRAMTNTLDDRGSSAERLNPRSHGQFQRISYKRFVAYHGPAARQRLGIPSGTCFVEHLPECQWVAIGGPGSEAVDTRGLESLSWIAPAVTTS